MTTKRTVSLASRNESGVGAGDVTTQMTGQDVLANGFNSYKEGYETIEKSEFGQQFRKLFHYVLFPLSVLVLMPNLVMLLWYAMSKCDGSYSHLLSLFYDRSIIDVLLKVWSSVPICSLFSISVIGGYFAWALFWMKVLPGRRVEGPITPNGNVPLYKDNGFLHYTVTMAGFTILTVILKSFEMSPSIVYDRLGELLATIIIFSIFFCLFLYLKGLYAPSSTDCGKSGYFIFDYYWGTELYPRVFGIDIKVFTNCRFGMTVWPLLVCCYAIKSYELWGFVDSMIVSTVLQLVYITKFFIWEAGYMQSLDIILDRAGFYICWGCLCYLPALYPATSFFLVEHPVVLGNFWASIIFGFGIGSIAINYLADAQRQMVRGANGECLVWGRKPEIIRAKYRLESGEIKESILLASGWWGLSRHFHYVPEILLAFWWSVPALFTYLMPYTYVIFLTILLIHRSYRDDHKCGKKYGEFWHEYRRRVPRRIVPYLF
ncbi:hypothetical protein CHS0354_036820 [Potamilus streckersoni]|uniref:7-dehydrocholesterol reductase n=1 Tax=Potamilus streckersoni TaxID=2493646 RepID=A0AAE0S0G3_9BIVA|nr:hypothetical protein CHS0354_036820 [Potamilus streckersoni]